MSFEQFSTELEYDFVTVSDGVTTWALNGALANLMDGEDDAPSDFRSSGSSMTVVFTSDDSVGGDGFVARYDCVQPAPPPPPPPPPPPAGAPKRIVVTPIGTDGVPASGHVMVPLQPIWFSFTATRGTSYQVETNTAFPYGDNVLDTTLQLAATFPCDNQECILGENDDDERAGVDSLESYLEWT